RTMWRRRVGQVPAQLRDARRVRIDGVLVHVRAAVLPRRVDDVARRHDRPRLGEDLARPIGGAAHFFAPPARCARRYASMNGSRSPSRTPSALPTSVAVRWSFTMREGWRT